MQMTPRGSIDDLSLSYPTMSESATKTSRVEREVLNLFEGFHSPLLRYAMSIGLTSHDAEEIVQEVFLALFRHLQSEKSDQNIRGWIFRVAHNLALKQRMANQRHSNATSMDVSVVVHQADPSPNPEEEVLIGQKRACLLAVLRVLPESDQHCLRLRAEGLRYREIAAVLGISLGSVSNSLTRSLTRLARAESS